MDAVGKPTLVMFSDTSEQAYGTCALYTFFYKNKFYKNIRLRFDLLLRISYTILIKKQRVSDRGNQMTSTIVSLLASKGKVVAPSKKISIVRLELNGALMSKKKFHQRRNKIRL